LGTDKVIEIARKFVAENPIKRLVVRAGAGFASGVFSLFVRSKIKGNESKASDSKVLSQFDHLDMITISSIAIMLSETMSRENSPYISSMKKADVGVVLQNFCADTYSMEDIEDLKKLFSKSYYRSKVDKYMRKTKSYVRKGIGDTLPKRSPPGSAKKISKTYIDKICETVNNFEMVKYISALSGNDEMSDSKRNYKLDHLSDHYKDALIYLLDVLLTCTCISKMLFVERMVRNMDENSEFYRIIRNMQLSFDDHNLIISKSRPIYKQYYQAELGYINGDDLLYGMAITIMVNKLTRKDIADVEILSPDAEALNFHDFNASMNRWLDSLAVDDETADIGAMILQRVTLSIKDNYSLLINTLAQLTSWELYYESRVAYHIKERDRERYLKGNFD